MCVAHTEPMILPLLFERNKLCGVFFLLVLGEKANRTLELLSFRDAKLLSRAVTGCTFSEVLKGGGKKVKL